MRRGSDGVVDNGVSSWGAHTLLGSNRHKIELVDVLVCDGCVDDGTWERVLVATDISSEQSGVDPLARVDVHQLRVSEAEARERLLDLVDLSTAYSLDLSFTNTISVEDDLSWVSTIGSLERLAS